MTRNAQIKAERRRRNTDALGGKRRRLGLTGEKDPEFEYRWINDEGTRVHDLTVLDDWEVVSDRDGKMKEGVTGTGAEVSIPVGMGEHGRPVRAILVRKPKAWYEDDKRAAQRRIDEKEVAMRGGDAGAGMSQTESYVPRGGIVIESGGTS